MAGKSTYEILKEDLGVMEDGMKRLSTTKEDLWQDELIWWLCKTLRDVLLYVIGRMLRENAKEEKENGRRD